MKKESYQEVLDIGGAHPSRRKYGEDFFKFVDELKNHAFSSLTLGHATEHDECKLRHISGIINGTEIDYECTGWPNDFSISSWNLWNILGEHVDIESLVTVRVGARDVHCGGTIYITEPTLMTENGDGISWNYYD